jgi:hypothetical protein
VAGKSAIEANIGPTILVFTGFSSGGCPKSRSLSRSVEPSKRGTWVTAVCGYRLTITRKINELMQDMFWTAVMPSPGLCLNRLVSASYVFLARNDFGMTLM